LEYSLSYQGESESLIKNLFKAARLRKPSIIFIDEIDSLALSRTDSDNDSSRRIKTELFVQMEGVSTANNGVFVMAATNTPHNLDDAILRRFDKLIYIPLPDQKARTEMFRKAYSSKPGFGETEIEHFGARTDGYATTDFLLL
jgi:vacuolar protein-sorting-associated protein 4